MTHLRTEGFEIHRGIFNQNEIEHFKTIADELSQKENSVCVRHVRNKSAELSQLAVSKKLTNLIPDRLSPVRSILFDKTEQSNWPVPWHQDLTIAVAEKHELPDYSPWSEKDGIPHVQPPISLLEQMFTTRIHLDKTGAENGALKVIPRSHLVGRIPSDEVGNYQKENVFECVCEPGDVLVMSPLILHSSQKSEKPNRRRILHFEYAPREQLNAKLHWHER